MMDGWIVSPILLILASLSRVYGHSSHKYLLVLRHHWISVRGARDPGIPEVRLQSEKIWFLLTLLLFHSGELSVWFFPGHFR